MNSTNYMTRSAIAVAVAASLFIGCASTPKKPLGSEQVRAKLTALQADSRLANGAPVALKDAEAAVRDAERTEKNVEIAAHRVYIADHKVDTARALAETRAAEQERTSLNEQGEKARLDSRTAEADRAKADASQAKSDALVARAESAEQKLAANTARDEANNAMMAANASQVAANASQMQAAELQRQLEILQAKPTDRGLVLTLGDTLFATGKSELKSGASANLDRITAFMTEYPKRTAAIEGFTDSMGSEDMNQSLSERRASSVKNYLVAQGVSSARLTSAGRGENSPIADNESAAGRQQNRRVEVVINQPAVE
jgi:outer membrane protein OmpA-like peptidoglycan-associated protein